jgi:hypothetical protein
MASMVHILLFIAIRISSWDSQELNPLIQVL